MVNIGDVILFQSLMGAGRKKVKTLVLAGIATVNGLIVKIGA